MKMPWKRCQKLLDTYMYNDRCTVSRQVSSEDEDGADDYTIKDVYTDIPCKISQYGKELQSGQNPREYFLRNDLRVCMSPEYEIRPNDILTVTHEGQTFQLNAAQPFRYPEHQEISVRRDEEA